MKKSRYNEIKSPVGDYCSSRSLSKSSFSEAKCRKPETHFLLATTWGYLIGPRGGTQFSLTTMITSTAC